MLNFTLTAGVQLLPM